METVFGDIELLRRTKQNPAREKGRILHWEKLAFLGGLHLYPSLFQKPKLFRKAKLTLIKQILQAYTYMCVIYCNVKGSFIIAFSAIRT